MARETPSPVGPERSALPAFLDYQRASIMMKAAGLDHAQLNQRLAPSSLTLAGILKHLSLVEDQWFDHKFKGNAQRRPWANAPWNKDPDWEFTTAPSHEPGELLAMYESACDRSRAICKGVDLSTLSARTGRSGDHWDLRWIFLHMIEETARHAGHADLIRESIDGATGA